MANNYCTSTDAFGDISEGSFSSSDFPQMGDFVTAASRLIDAQMGVWEGFFYPTTDTVVRYYDGSGCEEQEIDAFVSISELAVSELGGTASTDYTAWSSSDYLTMPYNQSANAKPITKLAVDWNGAQIKFYRYRKSVRVTGIAGYSTTTPDLIKAACKRQAVRWFMQAKQGYQDTGVSVEMGGLKFSKSELDPDIKQMLKPIMLELS